MVGFTRDHLKRNPLEFSLPFREYFLRLKARDFDHPRMGH